VISTHSLVASERMKMIPNAILHLPAPSHQRSTAWHGTLPGGEQTSVGLSWTAELMQRGGVCEKVPSQQPAREKVQRPWRSLPPPISHRRSIDRDSLLLEPRRLQVETRAPVGSSMCAVLPFFEGGCPPTNENAGAGAAAAAVAVLDAAGELPLT
jgi:hypothetical protein